MAVRPMMTFVVYLQKQKFITSIPVKFRCTEMNRAKETVV